MSDNLDHAAIRAEVSALRRRLYPETGGHDQAVWNIIGYVDALLDNIAELEAHPPMLMDPDAEQRGYDKAVANLLDRAMFSDYQQLQMSPDAFITEGQRVAAAAFLEAVKETPDVR